MIRRKLESRSETQEIATDRKLFYQILAARDTLEEDLRLANYTHWMMPSLRSRYK